MHSTLASLVERALSGNQRPLEFYLREQSRLPGPRANLELVQSVSNLLAAITAEQSDKVRTLLYYLISDEREKVRSNTPAEFVMLCGIVAFGACAAVQPKWRSETFELLEDSACSMLWRVREGVVMAFQCLLSAAPQETINFIVILATRENYFQQRAAIAAIAEPPLLHTPNMINTALTIQRLILERLHSAPAAARKHEDFRALRQTLGYTVSVVTAASPEKGFSLMHDCAMWGDPDINWVLRENLKKKRLAKFVEYNEGLFRLLA
jgi:hypothetical protein